MLVPSTDQSYDRFWRQAIRWLSQNAPDPVSLTLPAAPPPGEQIPVVIGARDAKYAPRADAVVEVRITGPDGRVESIRADPIAAQSGRYRAALRAAEPGVYRVAVDARTGSGTLGASTATMLVGGVDAEMVDPRLNEDTLQRVAHASGGAVIAAGDTRALLSHLNLAAPAAVFALRRDLWHTGWSFVLLAGLLAAEWLFRRASGLR
jgi:hypothetical protein